MPGSQTLLVLTVGCAFGFGLVVVMLGSMRAHLAAHLGLSERHVDNLWGVMNFVLVPFTLLAGVFADLAGVRIVAVSGCALVGLAFLLLRAAHSFRAAVPAYLLLAAGGAATAVSAIVLMPSAFFGQNEASASLNLGNVFFALGGLIAPAMADVLLRVLHLRRALLFLALFVLLPGIMALFVPVELLPGAEGSDPLLRMTETTLLLAAGLFFLYAPLEGCLHSWVSSYMKNLGGEERDTARLISAFWSSFLLGRLLVAYLLHSNRIPAGNERILICFLALISTVMIGNLAGTVSRRSATTGLLLLGFFLGPIFPTLLGWMFSIYKEELGTTFGVLFALGSAGSLFVGPMMSSRIVRTSPQSALRIPLFLGMMLFVLSLLFAMWQVQD